MRSGLPGVGAICTAHRTADRGRPAHRMPLLQAAGWPRHDRWRTILNELAQSVALRPDFPGCSRLRAHRELRRPKSRPRPTCWSRLAPGVDAQAAPFVMAALQVYWAAMARTLRMTDVPIDVPGMPAAAPCLLPASSGRTSAPGYRYLHCGLCATEWHMVRITCSHCLANEGIVYHSIEGGRKACARSLVANATRIARFCTRKRTLRWSPWPTTSQVLRSTC